MPVSRELRYLLEKQLEGRLTAEERSRFLYLLRQSQNRLMLEDNIEALLHQQRYHDSATPDKQALFEQVMREANEPATAPQEAPVIVLHSKWRRRLSYAAAIIIILLVATWYLINTSTKQQHPIATTTIQPKDSGQAANKVLLTLADGTQVAVDEVRDGDINNGLGAHIKKQQGLIVFNPSTAANAANEYNTISTTRGKQYHIILPDKTQVWLNAASSLKFPVAFNGKERKVALIGEGYFEVTKNPKQPFIVIANDTKVRVLGTHFNVMAYTNEGAVKTTLLEGSVEVGNRQSAIGSRKSLILKPGEQAIDRPDSKMTIDRSPNLEQTMAWKNGEFRFENTGIETIMRQVERWYNLDVVYKGAIPTDLGLSGVIAQTEKVTQLLDILEATHRVRFSVEGNKIIVMPYQTK